MMDFRPCQGCIAYVLTREKLTKQRRKKVLEHQRWANEGQDEDIGNKDGDVSLPLHYCYRRCLSADGIPERLLATAVTPAEFLVLVRACGDAGNRGSTAGSDRRQRG